MAAPEDASASPHEASRPTCPTEATLSPLGEAPAPANLPPSANPAQQPDAEALQCKVRGNKLYKDMKFFEAALWYTRGIELVVPKDTEDDGGTSPESRNLAVTLLGNRSAVYLELLKRTKDADLKKAVLARAVRDSASCVQIDRTWEKGHLRLATALEASGKVTEAMQVLQQSCLAMPDSLELRKKLEAVAAKNGAQASAETSAECTVDVRALAREPGEVCSSSQEKSWILGQIKAQELKATAPSAQTPLAGLASLGQTVGVPNSGAQRNWWGEGEHPGKKFVHFGPPPSQMSRRYEESDSDDSDEEVIVKPVKPVKPVQAAQPVQAVQSAQAVEAEKSVQPVQAAEAEKSVMDPAAHLATKSQQDSEAGKNNNKQADGGDGVPTGGAKTGDEGNDSGGGGERERSGQNMGERGSTVGKGQTGILAGLASFLPSLFSSKTHKARVDRGESSASSPSAMPQAEENAPHHQQQPLASSLAVQGSKKDLEASLAASPAPQLCKWALALGPDRMYDWFLDCYRFQESSSPQSINSEFHSPTCPALALLPFLIFCQLAQQRQVVPSNWDWGTLLTLAKDVIWRKMPYDEALERYGRMAMVQPEGDDSPNFIALVEVVYGSAAGEELTKETRDKLTDISSMFYDFCNGYATDVFDSVGGSAKWAWLAKKEPVRTCNCKMTKWAKQFSTTKHVGDKNDRWDERWEVKDDWARIGDGGALGT